MRTAPTTKPRIHYHLWRTATYQMGCCRWCAHLTEALLLASESLRFQGSQQFRIDTGMANRPKIRGNPTAHSTQPSLPVSQALATCARQPGFRPRTSPSLRSKAYAVRAQKFFLLSKIIFAFKNNSFKLLFWPRFRITAKYSKCQTSFYSMQLLFMT